VPNFAIIGRKVGIRCAGPERRQCEAEQIGLLAEITSVAAMSGRRLFPLICGCGNENCLQDAFSDLAALGYNLSDEAIQIDCRKGDPIRM
jgi:hypothetical protein